MPLNLIKLHQIVDTHIYQYPKYDWFIDPWIIYLETGENVVQQKNKTKI